MYFINKRGRLIISGLDLDFNQKVSLDKKRPHRRNPYERDCNPPVDRKEVISPRTNRYTIPKSAIPCRALSRTYQSQWRWEDNSYLDCDAFEYETVQIRQADFLPRNPRSFHASEPSTSTMYLWYCEGLYEHRPPIPHARIEHTPSNFGGLSSCRRKKKNQTSTRLGGNGFRFLIIRPLSELSYSHCPRPPRLRPIAPCPPSPQPILVD